MVEFLAYRILDNKLDFSKVPPAFKNDVKAILVESGHPELGL